MTDRKHIWAAAILALAALCPAIRAQGGVSAVRVYTEPAGLAFYVDGQGFYSSESFNWPSTSKHAVTAADQDIVGRHYLFLGWVTNLSNAAPAKVQPITADPALRWIKMVFTTSYQIRINLIDCPDPAQPCASAGRVEVAGCGVFDRAGFCYLPADSNVLVRVFPNEGFIFTGWGQVAGSVGRPTAFEFSHELTEPWSLAPQFQPAVPLKISVNIQTIPPHLRILADRTPYGPPIGGDFVSLEWGRGTVHSIGADRVQVENGITYVFDSWSDGGAINHDVTVPDQPGAITYTARFVPAVYATFATSPPGLKLSIDGAPNFPEAGFAWAPGTKHTIAAPATQTDAQGRRYRFASWSNGKPATFEYTAAAQNERFTAVFEPLGQLILSSIPEGLPLDVDGKSCTTPCSIEQDAGTSIRVSAAAVRNLSGSSRMVFRGWGDSTDTSREIVLPLDSRKYTASYVEQHRLSISAEPEEGAVFQVTPSSPDGFYDQGSLLSIGVKLALGFRTINWSGDFSVNPGGTLLMDAPRKATLLLDRVPAIRPAGVRNAAALSDTEGVAPGSLISIFGANLASNLETSRGAPLPQTLANVTLRIDGVFLPLSLVSPGQINAQLPSTMEEGSHKLTVRWEGKPEAETSIVVLRNAPGLFNSGAAEQPLGAFIRAGAGVVAPESAVRAGDVIGVLGTGFGRYTTPPPDGYVFDEAAGYVLKDRVTVVAGGAEIPDILYAGRSGAGVGVDVVYFKVPANVSGSSYLPVSIRVNGRESNTVLLPVAKTE